jgi:pyridoxal phosphate enzyme (YggS family)
MTPLLDRLTAIRDRLHDATTRAGRDPASVELMAVSKTFPVEAIQEAADAGQTLFGENRVQEILTKAPLLPPHLRWHLIGPLQSNKIRKILPHVEVIQSVHSLDIARHIQRIATELDLRPRVLLEVNIAAETTKHGFSPTDLLTQLNDLLALDRLRIEGLMGIPPFDETPEATRPHFAALRHLRDTLQTRSGLLLPTLSMGMSHDFEIAIEEGSTLIRVGTAIFGGR